jgi:putative endonuclease
MTWSLQSLVAIPDLGLMKNGYVYIMSNRRDGTLYIGVTGNLSRRIWEHHEGVIDGFSKRYGLKRLVYYEPYDDIRNALQREKNMKHWPRAWKLTLIHEMNPDWEDLYERLNW